MVAAIPCSTERSATAPGHRRGSCPGRACPSAARVWLCHGLAGECPGRASPRHRRVAAPRPRVPIRHCAQAGAPAGEPPSAGDTTADEWTCCAALPPPSPITQSFGLSTTGFARAGKPTIGEKKYCFLAETSPTSSSVRDKVDLIYVRKVFKSFRSL